MHAEEASRRRLVRGASSPVSARTKKTIFHKQASKSSTRIQGRNLIFGASRLVTPFLIQLPSGDGRDGERAGALCRGPRKTAIIYYQQAEPERATGALGT
jgi:hypothetical protein